MMIGIMSSRISNFVAEYSSYINSMWIRELSKVLNHYPFGCCLACSGTIPGCWCSSANTTEHSMGITLGICLHEYI